nr:MFS transporter [Aureimonas sp. AU12]
MSAPTPTAASGRSLPALLRDPTIRASILAIFFYGFSGAATAPYQSVIGLTELKLGNGLYALLILLGATVNVLVSISIGILADRIGRYRSLMIVVGLFGVTGYGLIYAVPTPASFVLASLLLLPVYHSINSLLFANVRVTTDRLDGAAAGAVNSTVRAAISLSWVLVPGLVALLLVGRASMLPAYLIASLAALATVLAVLVLLPDNPARPRAAPTGAAASAYLAGFAEVLSPRVFVRLLALALIASTLHVNAAVLPMIVTGAAGGDVTDIGVTVGAVALLEVVFIFVWAGIQRRIGNVRALIAGTVIYAAYLALLGLASSPVHVYALTLLSGFGAAAIISIPITYLQDLIAGRPGLGSSLISVNFFMAGGLCAALFAFGTWITDYSGTSILGALAALAGAALLFALDGRRAAVK